MPVEVNRFDMIVNFLRDLNVDLVLSFSRTAASSRPYLTKKNASIQLRSHVYKLFLVRICVNN